MMFNVDVRVQLNNLTDPNGGEYVSSIANTVGNVGVITYVEGEDWYSVTWDNGAGDSYHKTNLSLEGEGSPVASVATSDTYNVTDNDYCVAPGVYTLLSQNSSVVVLRNESGLDFEMPSSLLGTVITPDKSPDQIIEEHLDTVTADRPERSMVEYSLSVNRGKLEKLTTIPEFPDRDWSKATNKDENVISRLRVKGFSVHSIALASGLSYENVLEITNRVLKP
ncbi:hypothetical protein PQC39_gp091 [Vibrio phage Vp_R1]|uniref:Uncharacterized protein n=1 Tax=Vibrio phage Vp_R1 TaxID=2059867 RepID=A0A2H5BQ61_9CAUD|nr:hypothetical protein PQC39_gp091 [Vibrio phage Vp_R1]AUG88455.1 hypothetical protein VPR_091 [Vibrio phage Vp_R1]